MGMSRNVDEKGSHRSHGRRARGKKQLVAAFSGHVAKTDTSESPTLFHERPDQVLHDPSVPYFQLPIGETGALKVDADIILTKTPLPKGASSFSSVHIVAPAGCAAAEIAAAQLQLSLEALGKDVCSHSWSERKGGDVVVEYEALLALSSDLILKGANRATLLAFIGAGTGPSEMAIAALIGMLPFRGVQVAYISPQTEYVDPLAKLCSPSKLFEYSATQAQRMGRPPLAAVFGPLPDREFSRALGVWAPLRPPQHPEEKRAPFKIGAMELPMVTFEGAYDDGVLRLAELMMRYFGSHFYPVVSVGETGDALGYGSDILAALEKLGCEGFYFAHPSGESQKRPEAYGQPAVLHAISGAKRQGKRVVVVAAGGGVNGNAVGMIAALTGSEFVEVPTTLMHYNDATTSAKKAFSLVVQGQILSKNILGAFYLPQLVFCISETFLTLSSACVHAAVGEACKTMGMLGMANTSTGERDWGNILGAGEFARDFTKIIGTVGGFEELILFLQRTSCLKQEAIALGMQISSMREDGEDGTAEAADLVARRREVLASLRKVFHQDLVLSQREKITEFLTVINEEIISAKAMFLAYADPFEKYRALLFEYAHTLGHGVEAFMNGLYRRAEAMGLNYSAAFRLHGQCVGMAVVWAGEMSAKQGLLSGQGFMAHQGLVYLFNRFGGFDFGPLRRLCDDLKISKEQFCEGVLQVVRRDNKRGYCRCADDSSVDQLVQRRPGCLLRSSDPDAELRYLVEVSEKSQLGVLERAFDGEFDKVAVLRTHAKDGHAKEFDVVPREEMAGERDAAAVAGKLRQLFREVYASEQADCQ